MAESSGHDRNFDGGQGLRGRGGGLLGGLFGFAAAIFGFVLAAGLDNGLNDGLQNNADGTNGVVVAGNGISDQTGIAIGVHEGDDGDFEAAAFGHGVVFAFDVHDEHGGGVLVHGANAVEVLEEAGGFAAIHGLLLFAVIVNAA